MVSKVLAFATVLTLFLPPRLSQWRTAQLADPGTEQATLPDSGPAIPSPARVAAR
jgi:hypothetical protein